MVKSKIIKTRVVKDKVVKSDLGEEKLLKGCYGTSEWSANSGICGQCKLKDDCGQMNLKHLE